MPYRDYQAPGVNAIVERQAETTPNKLVEFLPVFIGNGMTSRLRTEEFTSVTADVTAFPVITIDWTLNNIASTTLFKETDFTVQSLKVHKPNNQSEPLVTLTLTTDYEVISPAAAVSGTNTVRTSIRIVNTQKASATDLLYDLAIKIENDDNDFQLRLLTSDDSFNAREIVGPYELEENGVKFFNDIAFAAEIAFRTGVNSFYYLEVPRAYGQSATFNDFKKAIELIYHYVDAYRIVPLTMDQNISAAVSALCTDLSNPLDKREIVSFLTYNTDTIENFSDMNELIEKVGAFSESLNNERAVNIFGVESVEFVVGTERYTLPPYFMTAAVAALDTVIGMAEPLSTRAVTVFSKVNAPYFRPRDWNRLAKYGVFIVYKPDRNGPVEIRHQLTTKQSETAEYQEYSMIKNFDAVTKRFRDRMKPYAGPLNRTEGYMEKMDGTFTSAIDEVKSLGWANDIITIQPWGIRTSTILGEEKRNLVGKFRLIPNYPSNNLDIYLII